MKTTVGFLGLKISTSRVKPGAEKIAAVQSFPMPVSMHQIRQYLDLTGCFRHFLKDYALHVKPITRLLQTNEKWKWGAEQEAAFQLLQQQLCQRPALEMYDPEVLTEIHTDASAIGLGGILLQK